MAEKDVTPKVSATEETTGTPGRLRIKLTSANDVRKELGRLYREARAGRVETQDASRLANMLSIMGRLIEGSDLESRVEAMEKNQSAGTVCPQ